MAVRKTRSKRPARGAQNRRGGLRPARGIAETGAGAKRTLLRHMRPTGMAYSSSCADTTRFAKIDRGTWYSSYRHSSDRARQRFSVKSSVSCYTPAQATTGNHRRRQHMNKPSTTDRLYQPLTQPGKFHPTMMKRMKTGVHNQASLSRPDDSENLGI